jgi:hypothetical protein
MRRITLLFGGLALITAMTPVLPARAQEPIVPFPPPAQYTAKAGKPFESLLAANIKWLQGRITDRKRKRRYQVNSMRLPGADKQKIQPLIDQLDAEIKECQAQLAVLKAKHPDQAAQKDVVKAHVTDWIKDLGEKAANLRKDAVDASERAKAATKQFDIARAQADETDDKKYADEADQEAKTLADDLKAAQL